VKSSEEADAAKALNEAFGKILSALIPWTANVIAGGGEKPSPAPAQPKGRGQTCGKKGCDYEEWSAEAIEKRQEKLAELCS